MAARHHPDLAICRNLPGSGVGRLCEKCDGRCPICDSYVRPTEQVRICDECNYGPARDRCIVCGSANGTNEAFYCYECCVQEKDRDGCPRVINVGAARLDALYERKKYSAGSASLGST
jgi:PHD finger-like domain-containing protein 5A